MNYAQFIDHTNLKQTATEKDIVLLCNEAKQYHFKSVCVNPCYVPLAASLLKDSGVLVCTVIGFPLGMNLTLSKVNEAESVIKLGADEVDMVINVGALKNKDYEYVEEEIRLIKSSVGKHILKVILETCLLEDEEIVKACEIAKKAGADFVKTSTGFSTGGATIHAVKLMRDTVGNDFGVKASGGIKTHEDLVKMIEAGASRIGTSNGTKII